MLQTDAFACLHPVPLDERVDSATQIAIGKIIQVKSVWDQGRNNIYTLYTIQSSSFYKQATNYAFIDVVLPGGVIGEDAQIMSPSVHLQLQQEYLLFLSPSSIPFENSNSLSNPTYQLYGYTQGALPLTNGKFQDFFGEKPLPAAMLLSYIENRTGFEPSLPYPITEIPNRRSERNGFARRSNFTLSNGGGIATNTFYAGRIEEEQQMVITGAGFGSNIGTIQFANSDNGGQGFTTFPKASDIVSWTDTEIRCKVPLTAGTGTMQVYHEDNSIIGEKDIEILWGIKPIYSTYKNFEVSTRQFINFIDFDGTGGYTLHYNFPSGLYSNGPAKAAFERALDKWQCATGVHFNISTESTDEGSDKDDICSIMFQLEMPVGVVAMTSSRYKASGSNSCDLFNTTWYLREFDMQFAHPDNMIPGLTWSYDTDNAETLEFDFETIALHELGHAHGIGHVNDVNSSMYYGIENGVTKRALSNRDIEGGLYQMEHSKTHNCIASRLPMEEHPDFCGNQLVPNATVRVRALLEGYYDASTQQMRTDLAQRELIPLNQPFSNAPFNYNGSEQLSAISSDMVDWVLIRMRDASDYTTILCERAAILHTDGTVRSINGEEALNFNCENVSTYYISITQRNHLSVLSNTAQSLDASAPVIDFTTSLDAALGDNQLKPIGNSTFLIGGDFDCNGVINNEDYNVWKVNGANINVYSSADADGNGIINSQDYNLWKTNRSKIGMISDN